jgi:hypothetical protein
MKKHTQIARIIGIILPALLTPLLLVSSQDVCSNGPLNFLTGSGSSYNSDIKDYIIIGLISSALIGYSFDWFIKVKSTQKAFLSFLGLVSAEALVLLVITLIVNWHCWTF